VTKSPLGGTSALIETEANRLVFLFYFGGTLKIAAKLHESICASQ
jgi:hypothetical protein